MDIVHLIETKIIKSSVEETSSHTYAEIEQTIALDHNEGTQGIGPIFLVCNEPLCNGKINVFLITFLSNLPQPGVWIEYFNMAEFGSSSGFSALHEDIDSPTQGRRTEVTQSPRSGHGVPVVSAEDLSTSLSSLHETMGKLDIDATPKNLFKAAKQEKLQKEMKKTW